MSSSVKRKKEGFTGKSSFERKPGTAKSGYKIERERVRQKTLLSQAIKMQLGILNSMMHDTWLDLQVDQFDLNVDSSDLRYPPANASDVRWGLQWPKKGSQQCSSKVCPAGRASECNCFFFSHVTDFSDN